MWALFKVAGRVSMYVGRLFGGQGYLLAALQSLCVNWLSGTIGEIVLGASASREHQCKTSSAPGRLLGAFIYNQKTWSVQGEVPALHVNSRRRLLTTLPAG